MPRKARVNTTLQGNRTLVKNLRRMVKHIPKIVAGSMVKEANIELTEMKQRTPVFTGVLRSTGKVEEPIFRSTNIIVHITFGGPAAPYAFAVHEDPDAFHPVGQWKYMSSVLDESKKHMLVRIAKGIDLRRRA